MKAGIYLVKNKFSEAKYLLSLNGKEPFIRIENCISLSEFACGKLEKDHRVVKEILENPENFEFSLLSNEVEKTLEIRQEPEELPTLSDDEYMRITQDEFIQPDGELSQVLAIAEINAVFHTDWDKSREIFTNIVLPRYEAEKWERLQLKNRSSSISEATSVIS